jgi:branched-chain amino acid transport system ATP-binding protein
MALLDVSAITVRFGGVTAVDDASLAVDSGSVTGLIGPNGAGKTTLFNVITGLQPPTRGRVRFRGHDVTGTSPNHRAKAGMGRTFQRLEAFGSLTVRENVLVASEIHAGPRGWLRRGNDRKVDGLIERVGLGEYAAQRADSVPTGVARLLEMARALAIEPRLLLLDEPSSGLDEAETKAFGRLLTELAADGRAVLMVEHDMDLVMTVCDVIHVLEFGKVIATGTAEEIKGDRSVQAAYLGFSDDSGATAAHRRPEPGHSTGPDDATGVLRSVPSASTTMELPPVEVDR